MTHPLHTPEFLEQFIERYNHSRDRCTGRSTAQGLELIAYAITHPYKRVGIRDHFGTIGADQNLANMMKNMVDRLDLQHMHFGHASDGRPYIVFGSEK